MASDWVTLLPAETQGYIRKFDQAWDFMQQGL